MARGDIAESQVHDDKALALYDPAEHRPLSTRFGQDVSVVILSYRSWTRWLLGYPEAALADTDHALKSAREMGQASTLIYALSHTSFTHIFCGNYAAVNAQLDEAVTLADEKSALAWKAFGMMHQGSLLALTGQASNAAQIMTSGISDGGPRDQHCGYRGIYQIWREPTRNSANSMMPGAALAKR